MDTFALFAEQEYKNRHRKLYESLDVDLGIVFNRSDLFYYSGTGFDGMMTVDDTMTRYVRRNAALAAQESVIPVQEMPSFRIFKEIAKDSKISTLGLELDVLPYRTVSYITKAFDDPIIVDIGDQLREIRAVKSPAEQEYMKQAAKQTDDSFEYVRDKIKPGVTEQELSAHIEYYLRKEGHPGYINVRMFHHNLTTLAYVMTGESTATLNSFFGPVSGQGSCRLHKNGPSQRKVKADSSVLIDTTGVVEGYTADETRTFMVGNPDPLLLEAHQAAAEVQKFCEKHLVEGAQPEAIFAELWELVGELGMDKHFMGIGKDTVPFIGHGIGLELDELPIITDKYHQPLQEGNIIAIEPKLIFDDPRSGVGIEDSYIVGKNSAERITRTPWDLKC